MTSLCSSGSRRVESALDPHHVADHDCQLASLAEDAGATGTRGTVDGPNDGLPGARPAPHSEQNRACAELECPQARQSRGSAEPQCSQNLLPTFRLALQLGHCIAAPPNVS